MKSPPGYQIPAIKSPGASRHPPCRHGKGRAELEQNRLSEKEAEAREATIELLRLCNKAGGFTELMRDLVLFFQRPHRLRSRRGAASGGGRLPLLRNAGLPRGIRAGGEPSLRRSIRPGETIRDDAGNPALDCMCGNILCGRFDPSKPFFTARGSFWTNCTTELLASTTEADRQASTRNRCNGEGYESVALVPLRSQRKPSASSSSTTSAGGVSRRNGSPCSRTWWTRWRSRWRSSKADEALRFSEDVTVRCSRTCSKGTRIARWSSRTGSSGISCTST